MHRKSAFFGILALIACSLFLCGCASCASNSNSRSTPEQMETDEIRTVTAATDLDRYILIPRGMAFFSTDKTRRLGCLPGKYELEAEDGEFWYFHAPRPIEFSAFKKSGTVDTKAKPGGVMVAKNPHNPVPGGIYIDSSTTNSKDVVMDLGEAFVDGEGQLWTKSY